MLADLLVVRNRHWPAAFEVGDNMFPVGADGKVATADIDFVETWKAMEAV
jgi:alcohol dehydrogenase (NADP+)